MVLVLVLVPMLGKRCNQRGGTLLHDCGAFMLWRLWWAALTRRSGIQACPTLLERPATSAAHRRCDAESAAGEEETNCLPCLEC